MFEIWNLEEETVAVPEEKALTAGDGQEYIN
jgi:hypothetical protein